MIDRIFHHGRFAAGDGKRFYSAMAVSGARIAALGSEEEICALSEPDTELVDLGDRLVLPGMHDAHVHIADYSHNRYHLACDHFETIAALLAALRDFSARNPEGWLLCNGLTQSVMDAGLTRLQLDVVVSDRPVILVMWHGHGCICNSAALAAANVTAQTENPTGSVIEHLPDGTPSGVMQEAGALQLVFQNMPAYSPAEIRGKLRETQRLLNAMGYTGYTESTVGTANNLREGGAAGVNCIAAYLEMLAAGELSCRVSLGFYSGRGGVQDWSWLKEDLEQGLVPQSPDPDWLRFQMLKFFCDGVEVAHTAWMKADYADAPGNHGCSCFANEGRDEAEQQAALRRILKLAHDSGYQIGIHTIGNRAVQEAIDAIELAQRENPRENCRHCLIHADTLGDLEDLQRARDLGIVISSQPNLAADMYEKEAACVGSHKGSHMMPLRTLIDAGICPAGGSDSIAGDYHDWRQGVYQAVTRRSLITGEQVCPEECITVHEALKMYTLQGAYQEFWEADRGSLDPGKLADFIVLDRDIFTVDPEEIKEIQVLRTVVGGKTVYQKE